MDADRFDKLAKTLSTTGTRRGALGALVGGTLGLLGLTEEGAARRGKPRQQHRRPKSAGNTASKRRRDASAQGPCGNGSGKANACTRDGQCCTGYCERKKGRRGGHCRCRGLGESCTETRNCCASLGQPMLCQSGSCQTVQAPPPPPPPCGVCLVCLTCNTATGQCVPVANGTPCTDGNACTQTDTCQSGVCVGTNPVVCTPLDQCHDAGACNPATGVCSNPNKINGSACGTGGVCCNGACCTGCCGGDGSCGSCLVFATSSIHNGNLGGLTGADTICQTRAMEASRPGAYKAWLSTGTGADESPATGRFRQSAQPYTLVNGMPIANNWTDLIDGSNLANPIDVTETGATLPAADVAWTHTLPNGTAGGVSAVDCQNWTSAANEFGDIGRVGAIDNNWTMNSFGLCNVDVIRHLYCFQQS